MKNYTTLLTNLLLIFAFLALTYGDTPKQARPDSHAPIGVMGDHGHKTGEMMFSYRFMTMNVRELQSSTTTLEATDVLKDFMMAPTQMGMQMHMLGAMFAPHNRVTFMAMVNYLRSVMEMQVSTHQRTHGAHSHSIHIMKCSARGSVTQN